MKFVSIQSAKGLKIGESVYTLNAAGEYGTGKLISRSEKTTGVVLEFEVPQYFNPDAPSINPVVVTDITHIAVMKDRVAKKAEDSPGILADIQFPE